MEKIRKWIPLFTTQFLGVLNDNILKNAIIFISILWLAEDDQQLVIPIASALLVLPFVLFSPLAGKWSQTKSKQKIFEISKLLEIPIMAIAVLGFFIESIHVVMIAMLFMGIQSAIYSPAKYGYIRELVGDENLAQANAMVQTITISAQSVSTFSRRSRGGWGTKLCTTYTSPMRPHRRRGSCRLMVS